MRRKLTANKTMWQSTSDVRPTPIRCGSGKRREQGPEGRKDEKEGAQSTDSESARRAIKTVKRLMGLKNDANATSRVMVCRNDGPVVRVRYDKMFSKVCEGTAWQKEVHEGGDWRGT